MRRIAIGCRTGGITLTAFLIACGPAFAVDATRIADDLVAAAAATGRVQASYEAASDEAGGVTISNLRIVRSDAQTITIPKVVVAGATPRPEGGFTADSIAFDAGQARRGNDTVTWTTGIVADAVIPSADEVKAESDIRPFGRLAITGVNIAESNLSQPVTVADIGVVLQADADGTANAFNAQLNGLHFTSEALADRPREKALIDALGYEAFDVNVTAAGTFDAAGERMTLSALTVDTADVGTVTMTAELSGVSPGKVATKAPEGSGDPTPTLNNVSIRFDNAGVVERALDMHAALIWGTREDAAAQVKAALPLVLHFIGDARFQAQMATAIGAFLQEPKSIVFTASPNPPVALDKVLGTALRQPAALPALLGADISAN